MGKKKAGKGCLIFEIKFDAAPEIKKWFGKSYYCVNVHNYYSRNRKENKNGTVMK